MPWLRRSVSILVFVELALDENMMSFGHGSSSVSILVFVELALDDHQHGHRRHAAQVSILVFVELALDGRPATIEELDAVGFQSLFSWNLLLMREYQRNQRVPLRCFNPCFRGTCS